MNSKSESDKGRLYYLRTRKEAIVAGVIWFVFFVWTVGVSYQMGYGKIDVTTVFGMPSWIFWGCFLPFVAATVVNCVYALFYLQDDDPNGQQ